MFTVALFVPSAFVAVIVYSVEDLGVLGVPLMIQVDSSGFFTSTIKPAGRSGESSEGSQEVRFPSPLLVNSICFCVLITNSCGSLMSCKSGSLDCVGGG